MSRLTRGGTAEPASQDQILRREREPGNDYFPYSADHKQDWQPYPVDPYSCYMCDHTMLYACVAWSLHAYLNDTLRRAHYSFLTRCIGWRTNNRADHPISYLGMLIKTGSESIEATLRRRRILFVRFVARMEDTTLPKCVIFGELVRGAGCVRGQEKSGWDVSWTISELSASTPTSGRL